MAKKKRVTGRRSHTKQRRPSPYKRSVLMILSVLCLLSGVLGVNAVKLHAKNTAYKQQEAELKTRIKSEQARAEEIKEYEQYERRIQNFTKDNSGRESSPGVFLFLREQRAKVRACTRPWRLS